MAADQTSIYKFRALIRLDELTANPRTRERFYKEAIERLEEGDFDVLGQTAAGIEQVSSDTDRALDHFRQHWLEGDYFPGVEGDTIRRALRDGFLDALIEAQHLDRPLNVIWVRAAADAKSSDFRVDHVVGPTAVTIAIITPPPNGRR